MIVNLLVCIDVILPLCIILLESLSRRAIEFDHVTLFSLAFVYYWVLPIAVGQMGLLNNIPGMSSWYLIFNQIPVTSLAAYLLSILCLYTSYILGCKTSNWLNFKCPERRLYINKDVLKLFFITLMLFLPFFLFEFRNDFFRGYAGTLSLNFSSKGPFVGFSLVLLAVAFLYTLNECDKRRLPFMKIVLNKYMSIYFIVAILILSLGGRLYFISSIVMLLAFRTVYFRKMKLKSLVLISAGIIVFATSIGVLRTGSNEFSVGHMYINFVSEPIFTGYSLISFIGTNSIKVFDIPKFLVHDLVNLIPTFFMPNKSDFFLDPQNEYSIYNPLGAMNSYVSFVINFGVLGSLIVLFLIGMLLTTLKRSKKSLIRRTVYVMICGFLPFTFFRDGFETSLIKNIFQFSILVPVVIGLSAHFISVSLKNRALFFCQRREKESG